MKKIFWPIVCLAILAVLTKASDYPVQGSACKLDNECYTPYEVCRLTNTTKITGKCVHKNLTPFLVIEWFGCFWAAVWLFCANCAGIGGGGTMMPIVRIFFKFGIKDAIALSNATIAVAATMRYIVNFKKPHPLKKDVHG